jgi:hypothetical protein
MNPSLRLTGRLPSEGLLDPRAAICRAALLCAASTALTLLSARTLRTCPSCRAQWRTASFWADGRVRASQRVRTRTIARVAERSPSAGDSHDSDIANAIARRKPAVRRMRSCDAPAADACLWANARARRSAGRLTITAGCGRQRLPVPLASEGWTTPQLSPVNLPRRAWHS